MAFLSFRYCSLFIYFCSLSAFAEVVSSINFFCCFGFSVTVQCMWDQTQEERNSYCELDEQSAKEEERENMWR